MTSQIAQWTRTNSILINLSFVTSKFWSSKRRQNWSQLVRCQETLCSQSTGIWLISAHQETESKSWEFWVSRRNNKEMLIPIQINRSWIMSKGHTWEYWEFNPKWMRMVWIVRWVSPCQQLQKKIKRNSRLWKKTHRFTRRCAAVLLHQSLDILISKKQLPVSYLAVAPKSFLMEWD